jgi:hypothetical protein
LGVYHNKERGGVPTLGKTALLSGAVGFSWVTDVLKYAHYKYKSLIFFGGFA